VVLIILSALSQVEARNRARVMPKTRTARLENSIKPLAGAVVATGVIIHALSNPKTDRGHEYNGGGE
jgi:transcription termination factor Rho